MESALVVSSTGDKSLSSSRLYSPSTVRTKRTRILSLGVRSTIHGLDGMLDTEIKILTAVDITEAIIKIGEYQVRLRESVKALTQEFEQFKHKVLEKG